MKVTLRDVAQRTGLSVTTVSRALNGYGDVAEETRQRIFEAALALGYTPNLNARRLKMQRAEAIGLILPSESLRLSDPFFSVLLSGIVEQSAHYHLEVSVATPLPDEAQEALYVRYMHSARVDGFIVLRVQREDARIRLLQESGFPFVAFGRTDGDNDFPVVDEDGAASVQLAVDHLVALGHTRIGCITEPLYLAKSYRRLQGYRQGLRAHNLPFDPTLVIEGNFRQRSGAQSAHQLLDLPQPPTAMVAVNDLLALGAMSAIRERGLRVGRDVSVVGFDDIVLAEFADPPLTTLYQPAYDMGTLLCRQLYAVINDEPLEPLHHIIHPYLVRRESTGPCPR